MAKTEWKMKKWLVNEHNIYKPSELQARIKDNVGVLLSLQAISSLVNTEPAALRFKTLEAICDALDCTIDCELFTITPEPNRKQERQRKAVGETSPPKRLYGHGKGSSKKSQNTRDDLIQNIPKPDDYINEDL